MAKKPKVAASERFLWWFMILGAVCIVLSLVPAFPWRYARVDVNLGDRFVMEKYYTMIGVSNHLGKTLGWFSLRTKTQRKMEEFGRPSPLAAIAGVFSTQGGAGGALLGCQSWLACKEHVNSRFAHYSTIAFTSVAGMVFMMIGAGCSLAATIFMGWEKGKDGKPVKKSKKKKEDECLEPGAQTMMLAIFGFLFPTVFVATWVTMTGAMLKDFKRTAYYPYAGAHAGPFIAGFGCFLCAIGMLISINRYCQCCAKKKDDGGGEGAGYAGYGGQGGYGAPPGGGGYGAPPGGGGYGGYGGQGW